MCNIWDIWPIWDHCEKIQPWKIISPRRYSLVVWTPSARSQRETLRWSFSLFASFAFFCHSFYFCTWTHEWSSPELRHCIVRQAIVDDQAKDRCVAANLKFQTCNEKSPKRSSYTRSFEEKILKEACIPEISNLPWKCPTRSLHTQFSTGRVQLAQCCFALYLNKPFRF